MHRRTVRSFAFATTMMLGFAVAGCDSDSATPASSTTPATDAPVATDPPPTDPPATDPPATDPPDTVAPAAIGEIDWEDQGDGLQDGFLEVPLDYDDPTAGTLNLYLVRHSAADPAARIGSLLVNPGGPGFGGSGLAWSAEFIYGQDLVDRFDIIGWDPRGTGSSEPFVDCVDDYDRYFGVDSSPDDAAERDALIELATEFGEGCVERMGDVLPHLSTENSARDMDAIRQAVGEETISYFGFSYGSELGATWATMFPATVRAAVLDGAVDPTVPYLDQNIQQAAGFEATFATFLAECSADPSCAFHNGGDAEGAFDALAAAMDAAPAATEDGRPAVTHGVLITAVSQAMYGDSMWPALEQALADLQEGDGDGILSLYDEYYGYYGGGSWADDLEAYFAIGCLDDPGSTGPDDLYSHEAEFAAAAPRLGRSWMLELTICSVWPIEPVAPLAITGAGAGPIVVVGTTGDAATPLESTRNMAEALEDGHLVIVEANQHTAYGLTSCADDLIDAYLVDPTTPLEDETFCS